FLLGDGSQQAGRMKHASETSRQFGMPPGSVDRDRASCSVATLRNGMPTSGGVACKLPHGLLHDARVPGPATETSREIAAPLVARPMLRFVLDMPHDDTMTALLWLSVIAGYAWSVWRLDRLWRHTGTDHDAAGRRTTLVDMRRYVVARRLDDVPAVA